MRREDICALTHAELVDLALRLAALLERVQATIAAQQGQIARLEARVRELEGRLGQGGSGGMPGLKAEQAAAGPKPPRKKRARGYGRRRMGGEPSQRVLHAAERCPRCGTALGGGWVKRTREVLELPRLAVRVIEHVYVERRCPSCRARVVPRPELEGQVRGRQRLGVGAVSLIAALREEGRLPVATIRWYLERVHRLALSDGGIMEVLHGVARQGTAAVEAIRAQIRASPVVNGDETGWREAGQNGYVWAFSTPTARYFVRGGRNKEMVDEALGDTFSGVLCSDFYAAYHHYAGLKQRCWSHLLRDTHELKAQHPSDERLRQWAAQVHEIYTRAKRFRSPSPAERQRAQHAFERELWALCRPFLGDATAPQRTPCQRIQRHLPELFVFVAEPAVPSDNNAAERSLRPLVTSRKISGGTQGPQGTRTKLTLATLFGTWRAQGLDPLVACRRMLLSPQL
jgi:transposase